MRIKKLLLLIVAALCCTGLVASSALFANDDDDYGERYEKRYSNKKKKNKSTKYKQTRKFLPPVDNALYKEECASCHFLFLPGLLPAKGWEKIINESEDHFGEDLALDDELSAALTDYLTANSAEKTGAKRSVKIMKSLGSTVPDRITTIPYIIQKHHEVRPGIYERKAIGSFSNCGACHRTADQGIFEEDDVKIPR